MKTTNDGVESTRPAGDPSPRAAMVGEAMPIAAEHLGKAAKRGKRKAAKLRAVWISFTGRIVAQFVGSAASILLGIVLIHNYKSPAPAPEKASLVREPSAYQGRVARTSEIAGRRRLSIVVLPIDDFTPAGSRDLFAPALTEIVTASLAERDSLAVLSRTSASQLGTRHRSVPAIARELGVDLVLEASVTRSANRVRVIAQLIDGRSDEHLWAARYDRENGDILGLQGEIAAQIARSIDAALSATASRVSPLASRSASAGGGAALNAPTGVALLAASAGRVQEP
jgi:TolB-like protein